jgi:tol-pal system protein YbgF
VREIDVRRILSNSEASARISKIGDDSWPRRANVSRWILGKIMKRELSIIGLGSFIFLFGGCVATNEDLRGLYARQTRLEARMERLSQNVESFKRESEGFGSNEQQIVQLEERLNNIEQSFSDLNRRLGTLESGSVSSTPKTVPPVQPGDVTVGDSGPVQSEARVYNEGYRDLSEGNYKEARDRFNSFLANDPNSPQAADAVYWIAESYYREGKFEEAILEFQKFIDTYPKDDRVPLSYLKQGLSLTSIGRNEEAKLFLQTLIDKFPQSEEARMAKEKLSELAVKR